jgi:hypothetical protein
MPRYATAATKKRFDPVAAMARRGTSRTTGASR